MFDHKKHVNKEMKCIEYVSNQLFISDLLDLY